jgi:hypothetical protein
MFEDHPNASPPHFAHNRICFGNAHQHIARMPAGLVFASASSFDKLRACPFDELRAGLSGAEGTNVDLYTRSHRISIASPKL